jgi:short-subunit dehydrogenase
MRIKLKPLREQTIVITGASSGIGLCTARDAARRGANVVLVARNGEALDRICTDIRAQGGRADYVVADVGKREDMRRVADTVIERHGGFDTWVNNAGIGVYATLEQTSDEDHHRLFQTNYWGVVYGSTEALRHLRKRGGALINIGSISSEMPAPILSAYTATKFAVKGFTDSLRLELMHDGAPVSVTLTGTGSVETGENAVRLRVSELSADEASGLPAEAQPQIDQFAQAASVDVPLPALPYDLTLESVRTETNGIAIALSARDVPLSG